MSAAMLIFLLVALAGLALAWAVTCLVRRRIEEELLKQTFVHFENRIAAIRHRLDVYEAEVERMKRKDSGECELEAAARADGYGSS